MHKWECDICGWKGDEPIQAFEDSEDGGYAACPVGCLDKRNNPEAVVLNPNHPDSMRKFARALNNTYR